LRSFTFILLLIYTNLSLALGLGDIELKSHLGEKLLVKVNVTDIESMPDTSCFSVTDESDIRAFKRANITFKQVNDIYQLLITTNEVINEPIVNLRVSVNCEPNISRDYVLLLDPAPLVTIADESGNIEDQGKPPSKKLQNYATNHSLVNKKIPAANLADASVSSASEQSANEPILDKSAKVHRKANKISTESSSVDKKLVDAYTGKLQATPSISSATSTQDKDAAKPESNQTTTDKPLLVISGGNDNLSKDASKLGLALRLETQIDFARAEPPTPPLSAEDAMDEVTVMSNRLAHLEKQIISLQSRNTQLMSDAEKAKNESFSFAAVQSVWLQYLLITLGLISALACAEWLRRNILSKRLDEKQASWFDAEPDSANSSILPLPTKNDTAIAEPGMFSASDYDPTSSQNRSTAFTNAIEILDDNNDESESILDNAEVFIAHNRPALAIQLLQNYLGDFPTESPAIWLKLLNLLAKEGPASAYEAAVLECRQFFNIKMPSFTDSAISDTSSIEDYPHIVARLEGVWGSPFAVGFLNDLIYNQNSQPREGFERNTFEELFFLKQIAEMLNPPTKSEHQPRSYQPDAIKPTLEKVAFNEAMFADIKPSDVIEASSDKILTSHKPEDLKALFDTSMASENEYHDAITAPSSSNIENISHQSVSSDGADTFLNSEKTLSLNDGLATSESNLSQPTHALEINDTFNADEIDFSIPVYETEADSAPEINMLNNVTSLESGTFTGHDTGKNIDLDLFSSKPETKTKSKKQTPANVIEWDLPTKPDEDSLK